MPVGELHTDFIGLSGVLPLEAVVVVGEIALAKASVPTTCLTTWFQALGAGDLCRWFDALKRVLI